MIYALPGVIWASGRLAASTGFQDAFLSRILNSKTQGVEQRSFFTPM